MYAGTLPYGEATNGHPLILGKPDDKGFNIKGRQGISGRTLREKPHVVAP